MQILSKLFGGDWSWTNIVAMLGMVGALDFSSYNVWKGNRDANAARITLDESIKAQNALLETQERLVKTQDIRSRHQRLIEVYRLTNNVKNRQARKNIYDVRQDLVIAHVIFRISTFVLTQSVFYFATTARAYLNTHFLNKSLGIFFKTLSLK